MGTFVDLNGGYGAFLKSDGMLVSWVLKNFLGQLGILQTLEDHQGKGYAKLMVKALAKEIATDGHNPFGTVIVGNTTSENLFEKLGFEMLGKSYLIGVRCVITQY